MGKKPTTACQQDWHIWHRTDLTLHSLAKSAVAIGEATRADLTRLKTYRTTPTLHATCRVDRYTSHVIFLMHLAHVITLTSWLKVSQVPSHSIYMSSRCHMFERALLVVVSSPFSFSLTSTFFSFTVYLFSVRHTSFHVARTMRSIDPWRCTTLSHAVWEFPLQQEESIVLIDGLSDADAAGCPKTRRSTSGGCLRAGQQILATFCRPHRKWCH